MQHISKKISVLFVGCVVGAMTLGACDHEVAERDLAEDVTDEEQRSPAQLGLGDDWVALEPGLWTRADAAGEQEFMAIGAAGRLHAIASLEDSEDELRRSLAGDTSEEALARLAELDGIITDLRTSQEPAAEPEVELRCSPMVNVLVDAYPIACGVGAKASGSYSSCSNPGNVTTYAYTTCGVEAKTHQCASPTGKLASCSSTMTIIGPASCYSYAYAQVQALNVDVFVWDQNYTRGACAPPPPPYDPPPNCPTKYCLPV